MQFRAYVKAVFLKHIVHHQKMNFIHIQKRDDMEVINDEKQLYFIHCWLS